MALASHSVTRDSDAYMADAYTSNMKDVGYGGGGPQRSSQFDKDAELGAGYTTASPMQPSATYSSRRATSIPTAGVEYITGEPGLGERLPRLASNVAYRTRSTWESLKDKAMYFTSPVLGLMAPVWNVMSTSLGWVLGFMGYYWRSLPALRAFTYSFAALTAIPSSIFIGFVGLAAAVVLGTAFTISAFILAGVAGFGLLFLGPVLFFSFWGALIGVGIYQIAMYGLRASAVSIGATQDLVGTHSGIIGGTLGLAKNASAISADMLEKVEALAVGGDGMPTPISGRV